MRLIRDIISDHRAYKKQIFKLAKADLVKTYRGSALGWSWALVSPVITIFVFWFAFSIGLRQGGPIDGHPFFLWLIAGFIPWFYMRDMIKGGAGCLRSNKYLVTKLKFPVAVIPTFVSLSKLTVNVVLQIIMIGVFVLFGYMPDAYYLQIPIYIIMMFIWFTLWALLAGTLSAISKDFLNLVKSVTTAVFWLSGIIYDVRTIDIPWIRAILSYNPVTIVANGYRHTFIDKTWFFDDLYGLRCYLIVTVITAVLAFWAYRKLYRDIPDVM